MATKGMMLAAALVGGAAALAANKSTNASSCGIICIDKINQCGERYGGCYDPCTESAPTSPPCVTPVWDIWNTWNTWYPTPVPTPTPGVANCSTITVCVDGINSCGIPFGACIPDCKPWNIAVPPCPTDGIDALPLSPVPFIPEIESPVPESPAIERPVTEITVPFSPESPVPESPITGSPATAGPVPWIPAAPTASVK